MKQISCQFAARWLVGGNVLSNFEEIGANLARFITPKTHLRPEGYPPPRRDHSSWRLRPALLVNSTFRCEAREFCTNRGERARD